MSLERTDRFVFTFLASSTVLEPMPLFVLGRPRGTLKWGLRFLPGDFFDFSGDFLFWPTPRDFPGDESFVGDRRTIIFNGDEAEELPLAADRAIASSCLQISLCFIAVRISCWMSSGSSLRQFSSTYCQKVNQIKIIIMDIYLRK